LLVFVGVPVDEALLFPKDFEIMMMVACEKLLIVVSLMQAVALVAMVNKATNHAFQHFCEGLLMEMIMAFSQNDPGTDVAGFCELSMCHGVGETLQSCDAECGS
ncbi:hypothetical protein T4E_4034, partial [Trichinella pseudospiralis]